MSQFNVLSKFLVVGMVLMLMKMMISMNHLLVLLLTLESLSLILLFSLMISSYNSMFNNTVFIMAFVVMVIEASFGLGVLLKFVRQTNSELMIM